MVHAYMHACLPACLPACLALSFQASFSASLVSPPPTQPSHSLTQKGNKRHHQHGAVHTVSARLTVCCLSVVSIIWLRRGCWAACTRVAHWRGTFPSAVLASVAASHMDGPRVAWTRWGGRHNWALEGALLLPIPMVHAHLPRPLPG